MRHTLPHLLLQPLVQTALAEDLGRRGDVTSEAMIDIDQQATLHMVARESGVVCGMQLARLSFQALQSDVLFEAQVQDGDVLEAGMVLASIQGNARGILAAERTALNFLTHLSGIATITQQIQHSIAHTNAQLTCTRKTIPGLRALQKYAVRVGGGRNHRMGLDDAILIKDNHIALAGGDMAEAIQKAKAYAGHLIAVEVEVDTLQQLEAVLQEGVALVLLDNMNIEQLKQAVAMCQGKCKTEASGGLTPATAVAVAETGVDFLAMGYVTHSAPYLDIGLDYLL
ncbi:MULTISPECIES: carboxylating nicotinate-nucleotide diphosphorylase [Vitreoscilla]|uniref:nicotinate-nucleotide diphosphorylase (carboxylating) n=1 Tax=Vitreoscilla stercoraria TaxID=61 RepID=A0ABY4EDP6_VITST|nr:MULTISPECIES: carboxylating nicotinate-nucleotide diphosphorylase [Vitreoscilla]AUZ05156.1 carboxylating nicotinate-nucleotide pyrophosphorylase [Vitreoscilla sp. C1]UOO93494.1 carboxylating nicotinate-nucleotide diphosphorylase [Vitreoscilla stercoraria]